MSWHNPQEDEFALLNMGVPSPYQELAFPNHRKRAAPFLSLDEFSPRDRTRWCKAFVTFLKSVTLYRMKQAGGTAPRLVLKSPAAHRSPRCAERDVSGARSSSIWCATRPRSFHRACAPGRHCSRFRVARRHAPKPCPTELPRSRTMCSRPSTSFTAILRRRGRRSPPTDFASCATRISSPTRFTQLQRIYDHLQLGRFRRGATAFRSPSRGRAQLSSEPPSNRARHAQRDAAALGAVFRNLRLLAADVRQPGDDIRRKRRPVHRRRRSITSMG